MAESEIVWSTQDRVYPKGPKRYLALIHQPGTYQFTATKVEKVGALSRFFDLLLILADSKKKELGTWTFKGIGKDTKSLDHVIVVSNCEMWPACLEINISSHCTLGALKWRAQLIATADVPKTSPRVAIGKERAVSSLDLISVQQRSSTPGPAVSPRLLSSAPWPLDPSVFPPFVLTCYQWLEESASSVDAMLRTPDRDEMTVIAELRKRADPNEIRNCKNTNVVTGVLRIWLRNLPDPPLPPILYDVLREVAGFSEQRQKLDGLRHIFPLLSPTSRAIYFRSAELLRQLERRGLNASQAALSFIPYMLRSPPTNDVAILRQTAQAVAELLMFTAVHGALLFSLERSDTPTPSDASPLRSSLKKAALMMGLEKAERLTDSDLRSRLSAVEETIMSELFAMPQLTNAASSLPSGSPQRQRAFRPVSASVSAPLPRTSSSDGTTRPGSSIVSPQSPTSGGWIRSTSPQKDSSPAPRFRGGSRISPRTGVDSPSVSPRSSVSSAYSSSPLSVLPLSSPPSPPPFTNSSSSSSSPAAPSDLKDESSASMSLRKASVEFTPLPPLPIPRHDEPPSYHGSGRRPPSPSHSSSLAASTSSPPPSAEATTTTPPVQLMDAFRVADEDRAAMDTIVAMLEEGNLDEVQAYLEELSIEEKRDIAPRLSNELHRRLSSVEAYRPS